MKKRKIIIVLFATVLIFSLFSCQGSEKRYTFDGMVQGTYYHIVVYAKSDEGLKQGFDSIFSAIDNSVNLWQKNSIINKVNRNENYKLDKIFIDNFNASEKMSNLTDGAFDITVGALVREYGFTTQKREKLTDSQVDSMLRYVGYKNIRLENNKIIKKYPQTQLDFNAIAQGYTTDCVSNYLIKRGINSFVVDVGGEVYAKGRKEDGKKWNVAIETPAKDSLSEQEYSCYVKLENESIVTSGSYRKFYVENGVKYSHTTDPKTGKPVLHSLLSASVIAKTSTTADGLATAFMVMGLDKAKEFLNNHKEYQAYFIYCDEKGNMKTYYTQGFTKYLKNIN